MLAEQHVAALRERLGTRGLRAGDVAQSLDPGMHPKNLRADVIALPTSTDEVVAVLQYCNEHGIAVVPHGGRTGLSGAAVSRPGQLILQSGRLNRIIDLDFIAGTAEVEAGVTLEQLQEAIAEHGFGVGIDLAARGSATLGGMAATNAGGTEAFRHGTTRARVLGLEGVLADGRVVSDLKQVVKANEGYDVKQLFIGSEGTLGVITRLVLALVPAENQRATALVSCQNALEAANLFRQLRQRLGSGLLGAEIMWPEYAHTTAGELGLDKLLDFAHTDTDVFVVIDVSSNTGEDGVETLNEVLGDLLASEALTSALIAQNERERADFWRIREESFLCDQRYPHGYWYDVSVPLPRLDEYTGELFARITALDPALKVFLFGHLGDGNLHLTVSKGTPCPALKEAIDAAVYDSLPDMGGSFSAEHGIGEEKVAGLARYGDPGKLAVMSAIKSALDPRGIMNPGKVIGNVADGES